MGQNAWCFQLRHLPRYKGKSFSSSGNTLGRPLPMNDVGLRHEVTHRHFPEMADRITTCRASVSRLYYISLFHVHFVIVSFLHFVEIRQYLHCTQQVNLPQQIKIHWSLIDYQSLLEIR